MQWRKQQFLLASDETCVDIDFVHSLLRESYWAKGRSREEVVRSVETSMCFSLFYAEKQIGFARVLTDEMAYAVILDMIIQENYRGQGLGRWMMRCISEHTKIAPLRQVLWTSTADGFYRKLGFEEMSKLQFMARGWKM